jgi:polysaccharide pyruvyl transferase CsaB
MESAILAHRASFEVSLRIIISGYYGYGNTGDEAILASLGQALGGPGRDLVVLSAAPERTRREHGLRAIGRYDLFRLIRELLGASLFVSGGGGLLQDVTGPLSISYYLGLMKLAQFLRVPTMLLGQGLGPVKRPLNRRLIANTVRKADLAAVRDPASAKFLASLGVPEEKIMLTADPVLGMKPASAKRVNEIAESLGLEEGRPIIAVAIRPWYTWYERQFKAFTSVLAQLACRFDAQLLLLPFHYPGDLRITQELLSCLCLRPSQETPRVAMLDYLISPGEMAGLIGKADLVIGMRLHSLIMAASRGVPAVGIAYDPKVLAFAEQFDFPVIESVQSLEEAETTAALIEDAWLRRGEIHRTLAAALPHWQEQSLLNTRFALGLAEAQASRKKK